MMRRQKENTSVEGGDEMRKRSDGEEGDGGKQRG